MKRIVLYVTAAIAFIALAIGQANQDHFNEFMALIEKGKFDDKVVNMGSDNPIAERLMEMPVDHWKSFTQNKDGNQTLLDIETKTGHKFTMRLQQPEKKKTTTM